MPATAHGHGLHSYTDGTLPGCLQPPYPAVTMKPFFSAARGLALPLALLLCLQWPLRDGLHAGSAMANDMGQILFALYGAAAVTAASRAGTHLAAPRLFNRWHCPRCARVAVALCVLPWALWLLWSASPLVWQSLQEMEKFPETGNPGYWLIKVAGWAMALLVLLEGIASLFTKDQA